MKLHCDGIAFNFRRQPPTDMRKIVSHLVLGACGWTVNPDFPSQPKYVLVGAPYTSNWDFPFVMLARFAMAFEISRVGKRTLFL